MLCRSSSVGEEGTLRIAPGKQSTSSGPLPTPAESPPALRARCRPAGRPASSPSAGVRPGSGAAKAAERSAGRQQQGGSSSSSPSWQRTQWRSCRALAASRARVSGGLGRPRGWRLCVFSVDFLGPPTPRPSAPPRPGPVGTACPTRPPVPMSPPAHCATRRGRALPASADALGRLLAGLAARSGQRQVRA